MLSLLIKISLCSRWLCQCLTLWCQWCSGELAAALSDCSPLTQLCPTGPEVTEPRWPKWNEDDLSVSLQGVAADTISHLDDLGRTITGLEIYDCTDLTAGSLEPLTRCRELQDLSVTAADLPLLRGQLPEGLRRLNVRDCTDLTTGSLETLTRCPELRYLTLSGGVPDTVSLEPLTRCPELQYLTLSGGVPDSVLDSLSGCPGLLVKSCRKLCHLYLHCTADTGRAVLTALKEADLRDSNGWTRTIRLSVPGELYRQLESQSGDGVGVYWWRD
ncbi:hypothetical protein FJT64_025368 [Amphibalanus amphitrite]|uniref:Uncharacterized protein n=1 Tax=Amphibalanus amphitrite TaxID=1232801 RepID=A0A6A4WKW9_AMPAM|nr:hypothetical protein FJT64_025368 [Amphibalanus amphitrite]